MQAIDVAPTELGGDLEPDVEQLAQVGVVGRVALIVAQGAGELGWCPPGDLFGRRELVGIDIDHGGVGLAQRLTLRQRLGVDLLCQLEPAAAGFGQADDLLEPVGARRLDVDPGAAAFEGFV